MDQPLVSVGWVLGAFVVYYAVTLYLGYVASRGEQTIENFAVGGRSLGPVVMAFTYFATRLSASAYIGEPAFCYQFGWPYHWIGVFNAAFWLAAVLILTRRIRLYSQNLNSMTIPEFIGARYQSNFLRVYISIVMSIFYFVMMIAMYKGVVAIFTTIMGWSTTSVVVIFTIVVLVISVRGFKAVAYTDMFQGILMVTLAVILWVVSFNAVGWSYASVNASLAAMDPSLVSLSQSSGLFSTLGVIALPFYLFISLVTNPYCAMRMLCIKDTKRKTFFTFTATLLTTGMVCFLMYNSGLFARVLYPGLADPDKAVPTLFANLFPAPVAALMMVGLFAAIVSTVDSLLHTVASSLSRDVYQAIINPKASDAKTSRVAQLVTIMFMLVVLGFSMYQLPKMLALVGFIAGGGSGLLTLSPLLFGLYWDKATKIGAIASSISGVSAFAFFTLVIKINVWERGVICAVISVLVMWFVSLVTKPVSAEFLENMRKAPIG